MCAAEEYSGIYARGCAVLTSVSLGEPSFAVAPGYGGWDIPTMDPEHGASCVRWCILPGFCGIQSYCRARSG